MHIVSIALLVLAFVAMAISGVKMHEVNNGMRRQAHIEQDRRLAEQGSERVADTSDYLTMEVWRFVTTRNPEHLRNYWREVERVQTGEDALNQLAGLDLTPPEHTALHDAQQESNALIPQEAWVMRLVADSMGMPPESMPAQVAAVTLTPEEKALSSGEKRERAARYIFGEAYIGSKQRISDSIKAFRALLRERKSAELAEALDQTQKALGLTRDYNLTVILLLLVSFSLFYWFVTRPFQTYALFLKRQPSEGFTPLKPVGSQVTRTFAETFNRIYADWNRQKQRLEDEQFRFRVAVENTPVIVYEYDCLTDVYTAYGTLTNQEKDANQVHVERIIPQFVSRHLPELMEEKSVIRVRELIRTLPANMTEMQVRMTPGQNDLVWVRISATGIRDDTGNIVKIIGKVSNIQSEKEKEFALEQAKSRDSLTGLYNKEAGTRKAQQYMADKSPDEICGIMLLDMDDFTHLNNAEGNVFADAILQDVADILRAHTGPDDILIRLGGDEFMLFIKGCPKSRATVIGPRIAASIRELSRQAGAGLNISASIGMCVTEVVDEYTGLYRCAESTLKYVKAHGKGTAACYLDTSNELGTMLVQVYPEKHRINAIDRPDPLDQENLVSFALELLGKSKHLEDAVSLLLARIGRSCGLDRVTIMEVNREYLSCRYPYQWAADPADLRTDQTFYITAEQLAVVSGAFGKENLCQRYILSLPHGMQSCLHAGIWSQGLYVGSMSFEIRKAGHEWTPEHRKLLIELVKVVASFILKARADAVSQAKSDFLSRMSHEIRTPMNAITGMTAIAKTVLDDKEKTLDCLKKIESANRYLLALINDILDMSRIESGKVELNLESIDLGRQLGKLETLLRPQAEAKGLHFAMENEYSGPCVMADEIRLSQVLFNIIGNAVKFTEAGGKITVRLEPLPLHPPLDDCDRGKVRLRFSVSDTGIGINPEAMGRIFNAFEQETKNTSLTYGGTGLGLAISSHLVQMMGGALEVKSAPGQGTEFSFTLVFDRTPEEPPMVEPAGADSDGNAYSAEGKRVLLAEDNALNREIAESLLSMSGFTVETAENGKEAADMFAGHPPYYYDAILMDIRMPVMDGLEATRLIRTMGKSDSRTVAIIALTANAFDEDMKKSLESGMSCHLSKPMEVGKLLDALRRCMLPLPTAADAVEPQPEDAPA